MLEKLGKGRETNWVSHWHSWPRSCFDYGLGKLYVNSWLEIRLTLLANKSESNWQCHSLMTPSHQHITSLVKFHLSPHGITLRWHIFKDDKMYLPGWHQLALVYSPAGPPSLPLRVAGVNEMVPNVVGTILGDRLKEKILKLWKGPHSSQFRVCLFVRSRAAGHTFWPRNLIFGLNDP